MRQNEVIIKTITSFGSSQASIQWTIPNGAAHSILVKIDPLNVIDELVCSKSTTNNYLKVLQENNVFYDSIYFSLVF